MILELYILNYHTPPNFRKDVPFFSWGCTPGFPLTVHPLNLLNVSETHKSYWCRQVYLCECWSPTNATQRRWLSTVRVSPSLRRSGLRATTCTPGTSSSWGAVWWDFTLISSTRFHSNWFESNRLYSALSTPQIRIVKLFQHEMVYKPSE